MKNDKEKYYGIRFNNDIPKMDKVNEYKKEVEIKFIGKSYLINRKDDDKIEKIEIENYYKLDKEGLYEIEFINSKNEMYILKIEIKKSYLFIILFFIILGILAGLLFYKPVDTNKTVINRFWDFIDFSILKLDIDKQMEPNLLYEFDVSFEKISSEEISLVNTVDGKSLAKNKVAPRS